MPKASIRVTLVFGQSDYAMERRGPLTDGPEALLTQLEDAYERGELTLDDIRVFLEDLHRR
jgi:hypothetical protein